MEKEEKKIMVTKISEEFYDSFKVKKIRKSRGKKDDKIMILEAFDLSKMQKNGRRMKKKINIR